MQFLCATFTGGEVKAKKSNRPLEDGDVKTACQQACPTDAIVFGNINNQHSAISITRSENPLRTFYSLEQLHVIPNVNYLAKVRNLDESEKDEWLKGEKV